MKSTYQGTYDSSYDGRSKRLKRHHNGEEDDDDDDGAYYFGAWRPELNHQHMGGARVEKRPSTLHENPRHKLIRMDLRRNPLEDELERVTREIEERSMNNHGLYVQGHAPLPGSISSYHIYQMRYRNAIGRLIEVSNNIDAVRNDGVKCAWTINMLVHSKFQLLAEKHEIESHGTMNRNPGPFYNRTLELLDRWIELITLTIGSLKQR